MNDLGTNNRILIVKGPSRYEVLRRAADCVAEGFIKNGWMVEVSDSTAPDFDLQSIITGRYDIVFMLQATLFSMKLGNGAPLVSAIPSLCIGWIFDDVLFHYDRICANRFPNTAMLSVDGAADRVAREMGFDGNPILPMLHGGFTASFKWYTPENSKSPYNKPIDILCPCTVGKLPEWKLTGKPDQKELAERAIQLWALDPELSPREAIAKSAGQSATVDPATTIYVNESIRYNLRRKILSSVAGAGLSISLLGETDPTEHYPDNVKVCGSMTIDEVTELIAQSKILLNPFPTVYEEGAHERIFTALINGAVCFTPGYPFLRDLLGDRLEYIDLNDMNDATARMREIVDNYGEYLEPILDNAEYALANHTWAKRGEEILGKL